MADEIVSAGTIAGGLQLWHNTSKAGFMNQAAGAEGQSKYPYVLSLPQDKHEEILQRTLNERGGHVDRGVEVVGLVQKVDDAPVEVTLRKVNGGQEETFLASYVAGCDGAHSAVRTATGIKMEGGTYAKRFFVTDVQVSEIALTDKNMNMCLSNKDFCMALPLGGDGNCRLVGFVPDHLEHAEHIEFDDVLPAIKRNAPMTITRCNWFSNYRVHHKAAEHFRKGSVFLCGDAAHLHSPVGGQGMNTGLGDVTNFAWKLAAVFKGKAPPAILDTYEHERISFANLLVNTTDYAFTVLTGEGLLSRFIRNWFLPSILPVIVNTFDLTHMMFKRVSQTKLEYRNSPMSQDYGIASDAVQAGDRLPWVQFADSDDNFAPLNHTTWQAHVYGEITDVVKDVLQKNNIPLILYPWSAEAEKVTLAADVLYLLRPDGHIGLRMPVGSSLGELGCYISKWGVHGLAQASLES